jgi:hypothetical protein
MNLSEDYYKNKYLKYKKKYFLLEKQIGGDLKTLLAKIKKNSILSLTPDEFQEFLSNVEYIHISAHGLIGQQMPFLITPGTEIVTFSNIGSTMSTTTGVIGKEFNNYINSFLQSNNTFMKKNSQTELTDSAQHFFADPRFIRVKSQYFSSDQIKNHFCKDERTNCLVNNVEFTFTDTNKDLKDTFGIYFILKKQERTVIEINADDSIKLLKMYIKDTSFISLEQIVKIFDLNYKHSYIIASCRAYSMNTILNSFLVELNKFSAENRLSTLSKSEIQKKWNEVITHVIDNLARIININIDFFNKYYKANLVTYSIKLTLFLNTDDYTKTYLDAFNKNIERIVNYEKYTIFDKFIKLKEIIGMTPFINLNNYTIDNDEEIWENILVKKPTKGKTPIPQKFKDPSVDLMRSVSGEPLQRSLSEKSREELIAMIQELTKK